MIYKAEDYTKPTILESSVSFEVQSQGKGTLCSEKIKLNEGRESIKYK